MSNELRKALLKVFDECLRPKGFRRKASTWYLEREEAILLVNLQRSQWGPQYYVNLAVWLKALGACSFPKQHLCHVRERLCSLVGKQLSSALSFEGFAGSIPEHTKQTIVDALVQHGIPFLERWSTLRGVREMIERSQTRPLWATRAVCEHLGINPPP
jgi:hypothetical protein